METISIKLARLYNLSDRKIQEISQALDTVNGKLKFKITLTECLNFLDVCDDIHLTAGTTHSKSLYYNFNVTYNSKLPVTARAYKYLLEHTFICLQYIDRHFTLIIGRSLLSPAQKKEKLRVTVVSAKNKLGEETYFTTPMHMDIAQDLAKLITMQLEKREIC